MNKISLISLALSFLFTIGSGFVSSTHSSEGDGSTVSSSDNNNTEVGSSNEQPQVTNDESENTEPQKKPKKRKRSRSTTKLPSKIKYSSRDEQETNDLNTEVLHRSNSFTVNESKTN